MLPQMVDLRLRDGLGLRLAPSAEAHLDEDLENDELVHTNDQGESGMSATVQSIDAKAASPQQELTDGFHLVIDALKLNGINTIYGVPGIRSRTLAA